MNSMSNSGMTTKVQHLTNPLSRAPHNNLFAVCLSRHRELLKVEPLMDRILELRNIESMRKTMLMQEEIFKQQVQDLHRLYNVQKRLMQELRNELKQTGTGQHNFQVFSARDDSKELSGSCSGESSRIPIQFDLEKPADSSTPSNNNNQRIDDHQENDVEVELTLRIGSKTNKGKECGESGSIISQSSSVYQENTRPHWLLQDLSLNKT